MENLRLTLMKSTMTYGAILGLVLVIYSFLLFVSNTLPVGFLMQGLTIILVTASYYIGIYFSTKKIRTLIFKGELTYRQGVYIGTLVTFFASVISEFYTYIQNTILDPNYMVRFITAQKAWLHTLQDKIAQTQIDLMVKDIDEAIKNYDALATLFQSIFMFTLLGFAISLITSAFLKTKTTYNGGSVSQT